MSAEAAHTVAVLGATGCVGRQISAAFASRGARVLAVARRRVPEAQPPGGLPFLPLDIAACGGRELAAILAAERVGTVVNATLGWGGTDEAMHRSNVRPVETIIDALRRLPRRARLVQLGTIHEYGPLPAGVATDEDVEPRPRSPYARAKVIASRKVLDAIDAGDVDGVVLRLTNTIGPHPAMESFLGSLARSMRRADPAEGLDVTVAPARRDYVDVRDAVDAVLMAAHGPCTEPLLNIGSGTASDIRTLVRALAAAAGLPPGSVRERVAEVNSRSAGADWIRVDIGRARRALGWRPRRTLADSMQAMWDTVH
ncbi:NAD-dependent epimerase/dehydratase family protein [Streptomyces sp. NPDC088794]|uniref:NAD-dependent epimerase/dehydratase family protein n=1 Tax=Streptomyces sp. NPDC088794 TaxID=3365902 RepID=UPI00382B1D84